VKHDDEIFMEFESPVMPDPLKKLRADPGSLPKKEKKGGKGKGKKKK